MPEVPLLELLKDEAGFDRTFKRYRVSLPVIIQAAAGEAGPEPERPGEGLPGLAHNISLSGIGFVCLGQFEMGTLIEIEITIEAQTHLLLARVRWCRPLDLPGDTMYHYGTQFVRTEAVLRFIPDAAEFLLARGDGRRVSRTPDSMVSLTPPAQAALMSW